MVFATNIRRFCFVYRSPQTKRSKLPIASAPLPGNSPSRPRLKKHFSLRTFFLFLTLLAIFIDNQWVCGKFRFPKLRKSCALLLTCFPPVTFNYFNILLSHQFFFQNYSSYNHSLERAKGSFMIVRFGGV